MEFSPELIKYVTDNDVETVLFVLLSILIFRHKELYAFLNEIRRSKIAKIETALECEFINEQTKVHLGEELATEQYWAATGIRLEKAHREIVINAHKSTNGELALIHFKQARSYLGFKGLKLTITIPRFEWFFHPFLKYGGVAIAILGPIALAIETASRDQIDRTGSTELVTVFIMACIFFLLGIMMLYLSFPVSSAKLIRKHLNLNDGDQRQSRADGPKS